MLSNITLGQYFPMRSPIHRLDARIKLLLTFLFIVTIFFADSWLSYALIVVFVAFTVFLSKIKPVMILKSVRPIAFILLLTALLNVFYTTGEVIWQWWIFKLSLEGIILAIKMALRIILLVIGSSLLTYTTSPIMLTDAIESLLSPFKIFHLPVHELAMMMCIALRFIPTLIEETSKIINAQKSRGASFETGNIVKRAKALVPILVPLFISSFRRAEELAMAMECRCYTGGEGRTKFKPLKAHLSDYLVLLGTMVFFAGVIVLGSFGL